MVMDFMETDLSKFLLDRYGTNPLPGSLVQDLLQQLLLGVAYLHRNSMMHRDLKPGKTI